MIPLKEATVSATLKKFNGTVTEVKEVNHYRSNRNTTYFTYTLEDCVSDFGISYEFCEEWLIPHEESEVSA